MAMDRRGWHELKPALKKLFKLLAKHLPGAELRAGIFRACGFKIGSDTYVAEDMIVAEILEDKSEKLVIGNRVAIGPRVTFVTSSDPNRSRIGPAPVVPIRGKIVIEDDAWIGAGAIILPNVRIGEGAIVGAGAVVTEDVPPRAVVAGIPAKILRHLPAGGRPAEAFP
jgi:acetyltransferase-like isoleucine patch superfamily enzyme